MKRTHLVALGACALAGVVAVLWLWRGSAASRADSSTGQTVTPTARVTAELGATDPGARPPRPTLPGFGDEGVSGSADPEGSTGPAARSAADPAGAEEPGRDTGGDDDRPRVYVRPDGVLVRDHRKNPDRTPPSGEVRRPGTLGKIAPDTILAVRNAVRPIVYSCLADADDRTFGDEPTLQTEVVVTISAGWLTVEEVKVQTADVEEATAGSLRTCVTADVAALTLDARGHEDVMAYTLTLPFRLRR